MAPTGRDHQMNGTQTPVENMSEAEAAAELLARHLDAAVAVLDVGVGGNTVAYTTKGDGYHLGNVADDYDYDVHLTCDPGAIGSESTAGDLSDDATVYVNMVVHVLTVEPKGYAIPIYASTRSGAVLKSREDAPERVWDVAEQAGLAVE